MTKIAETSRLIVRTWNRDDVERLVRLTSEPGIGEFSVSSYQNFSFEQAEQWIAKEKSRFDEKGLARFAVALKDSERAIGISGIFEMPSPGENSVEINYRYPYAYRGHGFATEAALAILEYGFRDLRLSSIDALVLPENTASKKVLERLAMQRIGSLVYEGSDWERWRKNANPQRTEQLV